MKATEALLQEIQKLADKERKFKERLNLAKFDEMIARLHRAGVNTGYDTTMNKQIVLMPYIKCRCRIENKKDMEKKNKHGVFDSDGNELRPFEPTHPSVLILDEMRERNMRFSDLIKGLKYGYQITLYEALYNKGCIFGLEQVLERKLGIDAGFWTRFQQQYNIDNDSSRH